MSDRSTYEQLFSGLEGRTDQEQYCDGMVSVLTTAARDLIRQTEEGAVRWRRTAEGMKGVPEVFAEKVRLQDGAGRPVLLNVILTINDGPLGSIPAVYFGDKSGPTVASTEVREIRGLAKMVLGEKVSRGVVVAPDFRKAISLA